MVTGLHEVSTLAANLPGVSASAARASHNTSETGGTPFGDLLTDTVDRVNQLEDQARAAVDGFMTGKGVDVHTVMIASQKASMALELALAVRNKAVQSYQSIMSMQF
jgi:flagellar hook-basal body complex protein FliE